ncbi:MAG: M20/M25/M40 family metallo-hydrolase [Gemmatimonadetes bacterium]|uniref:M20/M25/M40 family metallo-hydrolase n=1 Tax=Candidatus Kutchimonas denitrificans TaxID=3056748 RepID=A0AAE5CCU9_9BACT|nr:M20/M25/M40 family metallo-hydrolase [Gemmatimonadota bacterium]NIR76488.1 M20/M25/M40 family metallo-hydrolase [Candidatus Kutchimonas denitrificans]NIS03306.1 M20/M25/M40 family metallo-hydrolase [Gemmatimonadota bacterium]NIT69167.1 M20/M25/M40 family metallo-hydrolase [Gemmatimonadota bacterium]NIU54559.1 M20/M25/M40 family metallo-hydrolase [Gemmatimonadota bacterium]
MIGFAALHAACSTSRSAGSAAPGTAPSEAETSDAAITAAELEEHLAAFAHDSMMGRAMTTAGNVRATEYIAAQVERRGLEAAGDDGTYFQTLPLVRRRLLAEDLSLAVNGNELSMGVDYLPVQPLGRFMPFGLSRSLDGVQVIYGGPASSPATSLSEEQVAGKLVLLGVPVASNGQPNIRAWSPGAVSAFESAAGIAITALDVLPEGWANFLSRPRDVMSSGEPSSGPVGVLVSNGAAELLFGRPLDDVEPGDLGARVEGGFEFEETPAPYPARNVVAIVRGRDPELADQYVAIGSHNDHIGMARTPVDHDSLRAYNQVVRPMGADSRDREPSQAEAARIAAIRDSLRALRPARLDSVYNGADDDGSGSVAMLEIAEAFAASPQKPRRSILFVWHTGEERGLFGSRWFTENPTVPRESIVAQLNMDMVGRGTAGDADDGGPGYLQLIGSRRLSTELGDLVEAVNVREGFGFEFDYEYDADGHPGNYYCRSDHYMYARYGIPIVFFSTGSHRDYHQLTDEPGYIDYDKLERVSQLVYSIAETVANLDHRVVVDKPVPGPNEPCRQ